MITLVFNRSEGLTLEHSVKHLNPRQGITTRSAVGQPAGALPLV